MARSSRATARRAALEAAAACEPRKTVMRSPARCPKGAARTHPIGHAAGTTSLRAALQGVALQGVGKTRAKRTLWRSFGGVLVAVTGRGKLPARVGR